MLISILRFIMDMYSTICNHCTNYVMYLIVIIMSFTLNCIISVV